MKKLKITIWFNLKTRKRALNPINFPFRSYILKISFKNTISIFSFKINTEGCRQ